MMSPSCFLTDIKKSAFFISVKLSKSFTQVRFLIFWVFANHIRNSETDLPFNRQNLDYDKDRWGQTEQS